MAKFDEPDALEGGDKLSQSVLLHLICLQMRLERPGLLQRQGSTMSSSRLYNSTAGRTKHGP